VRASLALSILAVTPTSALATTASAAEDAGRFNDPVVGPAVAVLLAWYAIGLVQMMRRARGKWPVGLPRVLCFSGAVLVIAIVLLSPLDALGDDYFSIHMLQHLTLMLVAAPLVAMSDAHLVLLRAFPLSLRRDIGRTVANIPGAKFAAHKKSAAWIATGLFVGTLWFWHVPAAYDWALDDEVVHACEHLTLLAAATFFWRVIVTSGNRRLNPGTAVLLVSLVGIQGALLSALLMFAPHGLYSAYAGNPLDDQVTAGVLMCIPASFVYLGSSVWALARMIGGRRSHVR